MRVERACKVRLTVECVLQVKCHQYWPNPDGSTTYGDFAVTCHNEEGNSAFLVREMTLTHTPVNTTHTHTHRQVQLDRM